VRENRTTDLSQFCLQIIPALAHSFTGSKCTPGFRIIRAADDFLLSNDTTTSRQLRTCRVFETCHWFMPCARLAIPLFLSFSLSLSLSLFLSLSFRSLTRSLYLLSSSSPFSPRRTHRVNVAASLHRKCDAPSLSDSQHPSSSHVVARSSSPPCPIHRKAHSTILVPRRTYSAAYRVFPLPPLPVSSCVSDRRARTAARIDERIALSTISHICRYAARVAPLHTRLVSAGASRECFE